MDGWDRIYPPEMSHGFVKGGIQIDLWRVEDDDQPWDSQVDFETDPHAT